MPTHSSILAWRVPRTEEPGGRQSMGLQRVGHGLSDLAQAQGKMSRTDNRRPRTELKPWLPRCQWEDHVVITNRFQKKG